MRLKSLYIKDYKNIKDQTFDFSANTGYIALIGLNGSGKSNLLEAISLIFDELYGIPSTERVNGYIITFQIAGGEYTYRTVDDTDEHNIIPLNRGRNQRLPSSVVACYSGEDLRLWNMAYEKYYMQYFKKAVDNKITIPQLVYINKYCWDIALMSLMCSEKESIKYFLKEIFDIDNLNNVKVRLSFGKPDNFKNHKAMEWIKRIKENCLDENGQATMNSILSYEIPSFDKQSKEKTFFNNLYLLSQPKKNTKKGNRIDKYITEINIESNGISFNNYSEGHKKLILIECITQVLGDDSSLLLLDEPDAHIHIELKKDLLECIERFEGQTILTTHSPVFSNEIQRSHKDNLYLIRDGKQINADIVNKLTELSGGELDFIRGSSVVGSKYILVVEGISDVRCLTKAIEVWSNTNPKYKKLNAIKFLSAGGTGDVKEIFTDVLFSQIDYIEKVVFLFDNDGAGIVGRDKIEELKKEDEYREFAPKIEAIYYKDDISNKFELEDLFPKEVYKHIVDRLHAYETYRDFKNKTTGTASEIKDYIKKNAYTFKEEWYDDFKSVLDKILNVFNL
ncbi:MAG: AAA family ATPase [Bacteroidales bacterium]|nr:AAA family ATPase [Bacteroidales bacterium]MBR4497693.1 AAA family ATPase [Bacteroidales bacterium]